MDETVYRQLKAKAAVEGISVGSAINQAVKVWLKKAGLRKNTSLFQIKPESFGVRNSKLSEEIDEILYAKSMG